MGGAVKVAYGAPEVTRAIRRRSEHRLHLGDLEYLSVNTRWSRMADRA